MTEKWNYAILWYTYQLSNSYTHISIIYVPKILFWFDYYLLLLYDCGICIFRILFLRIIYFIVFVSKIQSKLSVLSIKLFVGKNRNDRVCIFRTWQSRQKLYASDQCYWKWKVVHYVLKTITCLLLLLLGYYISFKWKLLEP